MSTHPAHIAPSVSLGTATALLAAANAAPADANHLSARGLHRMDTQNPTLFYTKEAAN
jgi:hypothetical protein